MGEGPSSILFRKLRLKMSDRYVHPLSVLSIWSCYESSFYLASDKPTLRPSHLVVSEKPIFKYYFP